MISGAGSSGSVAVTAKLPSPTLIGPGPMSMGDTGAAVADFKQYLALVPADVCPDCQEQAQTYIDEHGR
jgi:hypothetical protein